MIAQSRRIGTLFPVEPGQRATIVGSTGSGKSFFAIRLLHAQRGTRRLVIDTKGSSSLELPGVRVIGPDIKELDQMGEKRFQDTIFVFRPDPFASEVELEKLVDDIGKFVYFNGNMTLYADELMHYSTARSYPASLKALATRGRERLAGLWGGSQRPIDIPPFLLSEASHFFIFQLRLNRDRQRISEVAEYDLTNMISALNPHEFIHVWPDKNRISGPWILSTGV